MTLAWKSVVVALHEDRKTHKGRKKIKRTFLIYPSILFLVLRQPFAGESLGFRNLCGGHFSAMSFRVFLSVN
jgi:hypothetical protein